MRLLTNEEIEPLLAMPACVAALESMYRDFGNEDAVEIPRHDLVVENPRPDAVHAFKTMSGSWPAAGIAALRLNSDVVSWPLVDGQPRRVKMPLSPPGGRYNGLVLVFSIETGALVAMFPDGVVQKTRVGASSGVAARHLAREDSAILGLLGSGWQAGAQVEAMCAVRDIRLVKVFSPNRANREAFAARYDETVSAEVRPASSAEDAVDGADIVVSATNSLVPTVRQEWLQPGMHVTSVRGSELSIDVLRRVERLVVNSHDPVTARTTRGRASEIPEFENGDYSRPDIGVVDMSAVPELRLVVAGKAKGRQSAKEVTCFHNFKGLGLQFAAIGNLAYRAAIDRDLGLELDDAYFTQTVHP